MRGVKLKMKLMLMLMVIEGWRDGPYIPIEMEAYSGFFLLLAQLFFRSLRVSLSTSPGNICHQRISPPGSHLDPLAE
jgi:hypothetical protein